MISTAEMASLRGPEQQAFASEATVLRRTQVADTSGGFTDTYTSVATYSCSFGQYPIRPLERESSQRIQLISLWFFVFPADADVRSTDRLLVGTRTFEVVSGGVGSGDIVLKATCSEVT